METPNFISANYWTSFTHSLNRLVVKISVFHTGDSGSIPGSEVLKGFSSLLLGSSSGAMFLLLTHNLFKI